MCTRVGRTRSSFLWMLSLGIYAPFPSSLEPGTRAPAVPDGVLLGLDQLYLSPYVFSMGFHGAMVHVLISIPRWGRDATLRGRSGVVRFGSLYVRRHS